MKICNETETLEAIPGHVYRQESGTIFKGRLYLCAILPDKRLILVDIRCGAPWDAPSEKPFYDDAYTFTDVTDKVCLKVKE
ncbi:MAG: hypothetical protein GVY36_19265 [Verrucomicrobia bacterium]|jgi:hypothetical protein|nr:hypothetical protein [Verrucomicrobiota bacterium]